MSAKRVISLVLFVGVLLALAPTSLAQDRRHYKSSRSYYNRVDDRDFRRGFRFDRRNRRALRFGDECRNGRALRFRGNRFSNGRSLRFRDGRFRDGRRFGRGDSTRRAVLTVAAPAAIAAGVGALVDGKKGAAIGALLGGGGGAAYYLIRNRDRNRWRR